MALNSNSPYHYHIINTEGTVLYTTLATPRALKAHTIVGYNLNDLLQPHEYRLFLKSMQSVLKNNTHAFVSYTLNLVSFVAILIQFQGNVLAIELKSSANEKYHNSRKQILLAAAAKLKSCGTTVAQPAIAVL